MSRLGRGRGKPRDVVSDLCEEEDCSSNFSSDESVDGISLDDTGGKGTFRKFNVWLL